MLKVGMIGAENSHTAAIAKVLNIEGKIRGVRATHVWGETKAFARASNRQKTGVWSVTPCLRVGHPHLTQRSEIGVTVSH